MVKSLPTSPLVCPDAACEAALLPPHYFWSQQSVQTVLLTISCLDDMLICVKISGYVLFVCFCFLSLCCTVVLCVPPISFQLPKCALKRSRVSVYLRRTADWDAILAVVNRAARCYFSASNDEAHTSAFLVCSNTTGGGQAHILKVTTDKCTSHDECQNVVQPTEFSGFTTKGSCYLSLFNSFSTPATCLSWSIYRSI